MELRVEQKQSTPVTTPGRRHVSRRWPEPGVLVRVAVAVLLALSGGLLFTWPRLQTFKLGYAISQQEERRTALLHDQGALLIEVESLRALRRIAQIARDELGMHQPEPEQVVFVSVAPGPASKSAGPELSRQAPNHSPSAAARRTETVEERLPQASLQHGANAASMLPAAARRGGE